MDQSHLSTVTQSVGLGQINLAPSRGIGRGRPGSPAVGQIRVGHHGRLAATEKVSQQPRAICRVQVDQTVDRKGQLRGSVELVEGQSSRGGSIRVLRHPHTQLPQVTCLAASQRDLELAVRPHRHGELNLLLSPAITQRDGQSMLAHVEATGHQITSILHRHLGKVHSGELQRGRHHARRGRRDHLVKVSQVDLELNGGRQHIRGKGQSRPGQSRRAVGQTEVHVGRPLTSIRPVSRRQKSLTTQEEHLLLLTTVLTHRHRLDQVLAARDVVQLR